MILFKNLVSLMVLLMAVQYFAKQSKSLKKVKQYERCIIDFETQKRVCKKFGK